MLCPRLDLSICCWFQCHSTECQRHTQMCPSWCQSFYRAELFCCETQSNHILNLLCKTEHYFEL